MYSQNRRQFIKTASPLALLPWIPNGNWFSATPDTVLYNANVITVDPGQPAAEAIAVSNGRILAVGASADMLRLAGAQTVKIDVGGKTILPGFIDAHSHPASSGLAHLRNVDTDLRSIEAIKEVIHERAKITPKGEWILGFKYDDTKTREGRIINRYDLDEAAPDHPVIITHRGGHSSYVNSMALERAGYSDSSPDPKGGKLGRENGELNGQLLETAVGPIWEQIPNSFTRADHQEGVRLITEMMSKSGVTSVTDAYGDATYLSAYQDALQADELSMRIYCMITYREIENMIEAGLQTGFGNEWVRLGGMKITLDGSISERTARLSQPYMGRPEDYGIIVMDEEEIYPYALEAHLNDWQIGVHANGDVAIDKTLNIYERLQKEHPRKDPRFRLEHCTVINPDLVRRIKALEAIPNPFSTYVYFHGEKMKEYGAARLENMFALRSFLDAGIKVTQTSDYPPGPFEPMMALQSSVTRTDMSGNLWGPSQRITVEEAIKIGTMHGAYASYEEDIKGSITPGKLADLVVLDKDPHQVDPYEIIDIPIERTMVGGKWVYES
jgi:predicted amidohydrolase YtcJ